MQDSTLCPRQYLHAPLLCRGALCRVYINNKEPDLYYHITLFSRRPCKTILLHCSPGLLDQKDCGFGVPAVQYNGELLPDIKKAGRPR